MFKWNKTLFKPCKNYKPILRNELQIFRTPLSARECIVHCIYPEKLLFLDLKYFPLKKQNKNKIKFFFSALLFFCIFNVKMWRNFDEIWRGWRTEGAKLWDIDNLWIYFHLTKESKVIKCWTTTQELCLIKVV